MQMPCMQPTIHAVFKDTHARLMHTLYLSHPLSSVAVVINLLEIIETQTDVVHDLKYKPWPISLAMLSAYRQVYDVFPCYRDYGKMCS